MPKVGSAALMSAGPAATAQAVLRNSRRERFIVVIFSQKHQGQATGLMACPQCLSKQRLASQRIGPDLELHNLALCAFAALDVPHEVRAIVGVERTDLPARVRIVDTAIHSSRVESERIGDAEVGPLSGLGVQRNER